MTKDVNTQQKAIMELNAVQAQEAVLRQQRQVHLYECLSVKRAHGTGAICDIGPRQDVTAVTAEIAKSNYCKANPGCAGDDLIGYWETMATAII